MTVVSDSSALIALERIEQLALLERLFTKITVPPAVAHEIQQPTPLPSWLSLKELKQPIGARILERSLGRGASESISLAIEVGADMIILDDKPARRLASSIGLSVIGTLGVLMKAKEKALIPEVRACMDALRARSFHISKFLYDSVLARSGELL